MPTYNIGGIPVQFPYDAYDCQLVYMERVISALQQVQYLNFLLPSCPNPTLELVRLFVCLLGLLALPWSWALSFTGIFGP